MKAKDLMLGDWVQHEEGVCKVVSIAEDGIYFEDATSEGVASIDRINPIPLTPEILEKNGWLSTDEPIVEFRGVGKWNRKYKQITFVHELQHALRLCGIDKEITI